MRARVGTQTYFLLLLASLFLFFLDRIELLDPIKRPLQGVFLPLQQGMADSTARLQGLGSDVAQMWFVEKQYKALQKQYAIAVASLGRVTLLEEENRKLLSQLGSKISKNRKLLPAHIIARSPEVMISRGKIDGLEEGMVVLEGDLLVGRLGKIGPRSSRLVLPSDSDSKIMVVTQKSLQKGILEGSFGTGMRLTKILQGQPLEESQLVLTSGEDGIYPQGLTVGKISHTFRKESDLFQEADVVPLVQIPELDTLFIVLE